MRFFVLAATAALLLVGPAAQAKETKHHAASQRTYDDGQYYTNVDGHQVHRPMRANRAPAGWTAKCRDGSYSFSENHRGTCSHHGGVAVWH